MKDVEKVAFPGADERYIYHFEDFSPAKCPDIASMHEICTFLLRMVSEQGGRGSRGTPNMVLAPLSTRTFRHCLQWGFRALKIHAVYVLFYTAINIFCPHRTPYQTPRFSFSLLVLYFKIITTAIKSTKTIRNTVATHTRTFSGSFASSPEYFLRPHRKSCQAR